MHKRNSPPADFFPGQTVRRVFPRSFSDRDKNLSVLPWYTRTRPAVLQTLSLSLQQHFCFSAKGPLSDIFPSVCGLIPKAHDSALFSQLPESVLPSLPPSSLPAGNREIHGFQKRRLFPQILWICENPPRFSPGKARNDICGERRIFKIFSQDPAFFPRYSPAGIPAVHPPQRPIAPRSAGKDEKCGQTLGSRLNCSAKRSVIIPGSREPSRILAMPSTGCSSRISFQQAGAVFKIRPVGAQMNPREHDLPAAGHRQPLKPPAETSWGSRLRTRPLV